MAGIEPASFDVLPVLLRAQPVIRFSGPPLATGTGGGPQSAKCVPDGLPTQPSGKSRKMTPVPDPQDWDRTDGSLLSGQCELRLGICLWVPAL